MVQRDIYPEGAVVKAIYPAGRPLLAPAEAPAFGHAVTAGGQVLAMVAKDAGEGKGGRGGCELRVWDPAAGRVLGSRTFGPDSRLATQAGSV